MSKRLLLLLAIGIVVTHAQDLGVLSNSAPRHGGYAWVVNGTVTSVTPDSVKIPAGSSLLAPVNNGTPVENSNKSKPSTTTAPIVANTNVSTSNATNSTLPVNQSSKKIVKTGQPQITPAQPTTEAVAGPTFDTPSQRALLSNDPLYCFLRPKKCTMQDTQVTKNKQTVATTSETNVNTPTKQAVNTPPKQTVINPPSRTVVSPPKPTLEKQTPIPTSPPASKP